MVAEETFLGWYATDSQDSEALTNLARDSLLKYNLSIIDCIGITTDGAMNMRGKHRGVKARFKNLSQSILHVYCAGHALNLVSRQSTENVEACLSSLEFASGIARYIKGSQKRQQEWKSFCADIDQGYLGGDFFAGRADAAQSSENSEDRAKAREYVNRMDDFRTYYALRVMDDAYDVILPIHAGLQSPELSVCAAIAMIEGLQKNLLGYAQDWSRLKGFYEMVKDDSLKMNIEGPRLERAARKGFRPSRAGLSGEQKEDLSLVQHVGPTLSGESTAPC
ncbi:hypothetical protein Pmar_PMAR001380 [Perkinsus marinus ATCC 50983]|uniref:DUF4371 domain-containing protein n=1 Tax=Perkinsus marinus (strain ATCC 50983 / TXsc) TaxID=423536 RepID=C5KJJ6_PERM5|nr:hypothetical protein Pmar_PMAR001380 [Perkinsus marinus ATCC 50983]EER15330.1 hypothetical protein Pmar_PMAR001380 [Perkinsus marinus ATCC 50983]|eukprot:XP_002783534.1 hypothetical protein Pmar_PMAR001380 [Perkinsus marinus ATCC 50983]